MSAYAAAGGLPSVNKAFVREPDADARVVCPRCGSQGTVVGSGPIETYVRPESRSLLLDGAFYCVNAGCDVVYYNMFEQFVRVSELMSPAYPYDINAAICACFSFTYDDLEADVQDGEPTRIRALLAKSKTAEARCHIAAVDGQCCMREVQRLFMKLREAGR